MEHEVCGMQQTVARPVTHHMPISSLAFFFRCCLIFPSRHKVKLAWQSPGQCLTWQMFIGCPGDFHTGMAPPIIASFQQLTCKVILQTVLWRALSLIPPSTPPMFENPKEGRFKFLFWSWSLPPPTVYCLESKIMRKDAKSELLNIKKPLNTICKLAKSCAI